MTNEQIETQIKNLIRVERRTTAEILKLINLAESRDIPLKRGFASTFDWLTKGLGYSGAAAFRRLSSARLMRAVPEVEAKLESGAVNLTTLSNAQKAIRASEKVTGRKMGAHRKAEIVTAIAHQSSQDSEVTLLKMMPETASTIYEERARPLDAEYTRLFFNLDSAAMADLAWVTDYLSHVRPDGSRGRVFAEVLRKFRHGVEKKKTIKAKRARCTFTDDHTGHRCGNTFMIEIDHRVPKALGGSDAPENRRPLCRNHNQMMARKLLGPGWANVYRRNRIRFRSESESQPIAFSAPGEG